MECKYEAKIPAAANADAAPRTRWWPRSRRLLTPMRSSRLKSRTSASTLPNKTTSSCSSGPKLKGLPPSSLGPTKRFKQGLELCDS